MRSHATWHGESSPNSTRTWRSCVGDAFRVAWGYRPDIIISNPPFVRWSLLDRECRRGLLDLMGRLGCAEFISRGDPVQSAPARPKARIANVLSAVA